MDILHDAADAEDTVQEAFIVAWTKLSTLRRSDGFAAWLRTIVRSRALDRLRRRAAIGTIPTDSVAARPGVQRVAEGLHLSSERSRDAVEALAALPTDERDAMFTRAINDFTYQETAHALGVSVTTAKGRIQRARARMRELLAADPPEENSVDNERMARDVGESVDKIARLSIDERIPLNGTRHIVVFVGMNAEIELCQNGAAGDGAEDVVVVTGSKAAVGPTSEGASAALDGLRVLHDQVDDYAETGPHPHLIPSWRSGPDQDDGCSVDPWKTFFSPQPYVWSLPDSLDPPANACGPRERPVVEVPDEDIRSAFIASLRPPTTRVSVVHEEMHETAIPYDGLSEVVRRVFAATKGPGAVEFRDDGPHPEGYLRAPAGTVDLVVAVPRGVTVTILHGLIGTRTDHLVELPSPGVRVRARSVEANLNLSACDGSELIDVAGDCNLLDMHLTSARGIRGSFRLSHHDLGPMNDGTSDVFERTAPLPTQVDDVVGDVHIDALRLELALTGVQGSVYARNCFGPTRMHLAHHEPGCRYLVESESGAVSVRIDDAVFDEYLHQRVHARTLCGTIDFKVPWSGTTPTPAYLEWGHNGKNDEEELGYRDETVLAVSRSGPLVLGIASWLDREGAW